jgi:hypothetical protein
MWLHTGAFFGLSLGVVVVLVLCIVAGSRLLVPQAARGAVAKPMPNHERMAATPSDKATIGTKETIPPNGHHGLEPMRGCVLIETPAGVVFTFSEDIFDHGEIYSSGAREILLEVAKNLSARAGSAQIFVRGTTDAKTVRPGSPFKDNEFLALRRAACVAQTMRGSASFPQGSLLVTDAFPAGMSPSMVGKGLNGGKRSAEILISWSKDSPETPK